MVCITIVRRFQSCISIPKGRMLEKTMKGFQERHDIPQTAGAIDGTHIPIISPKDNIAEYFNGKGKYSIVMQAVVDHQHQFWDVNIGWSGRIHDARIFANSKLYRFAEQNKLFPSDTKNIRGVDVPVIQLTLYCHD